MSRVQVPLLTLIDQGPVCENRPALLHAHPAPGAPGLLPTESDRPCRTGHVRRGRTDSQQPVGPGSVRRGRTRESRHGDHCSCSQPLHARPAVAARPRVARRRRRGAPGRRPAGTAPRLAVPRAVEPDRRLRPGRPRRRRGRPPGSQVDADADHSAHGPRGGLPGLPRGRGADGARLQTRLPLHGVRAHPRRRRRARPGSAEVRRPATDLRRDPGVARRAGGRAEGAGDLAAAAAVRAAVARARRRALVVRYPAVVRRGSRHAAGADRS